MKEALEAIAAFPQEEPLHEYLRSQGVRFHELEPSYVKMAKAASIALHPTPVPQAGE